MVIMAAATTSQARSWYFDKASIGGTCSNSGQGTISQPFCDIMSKLWDDSWNGAQAGETIYIRQGTYTGRLFWIKQGVLANGTPSQPITIRPYPGETVVFDGQGTDLFMVYSGATNIVHDLSFIGPFEIKNYIKVLDGDFPNAPRTNLLFDNLDVHDGSMGLLFRYVDGVIVKNSQFHDLKGFASGIDDNVIGVSVRGVLGNLSDNITIDNCVAHDINDGKGNDNGDADGFHTDQFVNHFTIKNSSAYRCSEDGMDTKARVVLLENVKAWDNGATGIKMWGGNIGIPSSYTMRGALTYGNSETGVKCTGWGPASTDRVTATVDHLTSWGNGEDGFKLSVGTDTSAGCNVTLRNSIIGATRDDDLTIYVPRTGYDSTVNLADTDIYHTGSVNSITAMGCAPLSGKYTPAQYAANTFNTDLSGGYACGGVFGTLTGTSSRPLIFNPLLVDAPPKFEWASVAESAITANTVMLYDPVAEASYPWPNPVVGHYVEINDDGVKRQITAVNATTRIITFSPAVSSSVCGRAMDCRGVRVVGWATSTVYTDNMHLSKTSPAVDAGTLVSGVDCALGDLNGGAALTGCIHWRGTKPDLGFTEFGIPKLLITGGSGN